jgi:ABC-2 type transport system ATP-binding protein
MNVLTVNGITKRYKRVTALDDVSLAVPEGAVQGILGPNGSGKTTLLGIVTGVIRPSAGTFRFLDDDKPPREARKEAGVLLETPNFYPYLSARHNLEIAARVKGKALDDIPRVLKTVGLLARQHDAFKTYSLGMKQRLAIASALLGNPRVVILDEPTNGLDPEGIAEIRRVIKRLAVEGKTIILASHLLDEVEKVCTRVAILARGRLLADGDIGDVLSSGTSALELAAADTAALARVVATLDGVTGTRENGTGITVYYKAGELTAARVNKHCFDNGITLERLAAMNENLESRFLELTK